MPSTRSGKQSTPVSHPLSSRPTKKDVPNNNELRVIAAVAEDNDDDIARNNESSPQAEQSSSITNQFLPDGFIHPHYCQQLADKYIFDILDYIAEQILRNQQNRIFQYEILTKFWHNHYVHAHKLFGRLYVRKLLSSILADVCSSEQPSTDVFTWNVDAWQEFRKELVIARDACVRKDCRVFHEMTSETQPDREFADHANERWFTKELDKVILLCCIHEFVAPIRHQCAKQIREGDMMMGPLRMCLDEETALIEAMKKPEYNAVKRHLVNLFVETNPLPQHLKGVAELQKVLSNGPFNMDHFKKQMEKLIQTWNKLCFGSEKSTLYERGYKPGDLSPREKSVPGSPRNLVSSYRRGSGLSSPEYQKVQRQRVSKKSAQDMNFTVVQESSHHSACPQNRVKQPSQQQQEDACDTVLGETEQGTTTAQNHSENESPARQKAKRKSQRDSNDELSDDDFDEPIKLSKVPKRRKSKRVSTTGYQPDPGRFDESGRATRKVPFDEEEDNAIIAGIKDPNLGVGNWAGIKEKFAEILRNRTSVMIKDRYRVLLAQGRFNFELAPENGLATDEQGEPDNVSNGVASESDDDIILNV